MAKIGIVLSGCGVFDGSEIHESVITMLALDRAGVEIICMAPDIKQPQVIDHISGTAAHEDRNVLTESARISRGKIRNISTVTAAEIDALVLPGGFGAAKNLCNFATMGANCTVNPELSALVTAMVAAAKPIGSICISPVILAKVLGSQGKNPQLTIGNDATTAAAINQMGANHVECAVDACVVDQKLKIVSTPAYMLAGSISEAAAGIEAAIAALLKLL
ncbi:MAG: isoprenoid biosynthesis glyoxalase ElbB [Desulfuromonas sp.]|nr:isoprenoid biosynthesis glyoxalase ElbB [Desulfuromonas sp.]